MTEGYLSKDNNPIMTLDHLLIAVIRATEPARDNQGLMSFSSLIILTLVLILIHIEMSISLKLSNMSKLPKLIAFDLDGTVWSPDMYMLWGGGSPFSVLDSSGQILLDCSNKQVRLLGICNTLFDEFLYNDIWKQTKFAWVSCTGV